MDIIVPGTYDLFHEGHKKLLDYAQKLGKVVAVVNGDNISSKKLAQDEWTRYLNVRNYLSCDHQVLITNTNSLDIALHHTPCFWLTGRDWSLKKTSKRNNVPETFWEEHEIYLIYKDRLPEISSTKLRNENN